MQRYTINAFNRDYPNEPACLERLRSRRYPDGSTCEKCQRTTKYHRDVGRRSYSCQWCGHHVHPTAGTIFEKSTTSLRLWFYAIFKMASTRCGISAKQLERELGVTYKTPVFGMAERKGRVVATAVPNAKRATITPHVQKKVLPETTVYTDEYRVYD